MTFSRDWLKHISEETVEIGKRGYYWNREGEKVMIDEDLQKALEGSVHYHSSHKFSLPGKPGNFDTQFILAYGSSLQVATQLQGEDTHVGVLNSASGKSPDKFLRGTISQEECILRATLLYPCLQQFENKPHYFYYINNKEKYKQSASACAIYAPHVPVIRKDNVQGQLLDQYELCSFVNIPAVNAFVLGRQEHELNIPKAQSPGQCAAGVPHEHMTLHQAMYDRLLRALCIFQEQGCTELVLCAFGCGVHGNNPESVAKVFREILLESTMAGHFRTVVFAIQPARVDNYKAFQEVFPEAATV
jgi:uncharacterized protein (TIGR02452 family)